MPTVGERLKSGLYECRVMHARFVPRGHRFLYRIFLFAIDLDELDELPRRLPLFSVGGRNLYSFRDRDYLPIDEPLHPAAASVSRNAGAGPPSAHSAQLRARVEAFAASHGTNLSGGRVVLVTLPRVFGYLFNPVSFYFCYNRHGVPAAVIAEVTNTFREVKPYFLGAETRSANGEFHLRIPKHFYVSPFSEVDVEFDFTLRAPGDRLSLQIDDFAHGARTLTTTLTGSRRELTSARLAWFTMKYPFVTLRVIALIHWHALLLWCKRVPWFAKAARASEQRGLHRPHPSLAPAARGTPPPEVSGARHAHPVSLQPSDVA